MGDKDIILVNITLFGLNTNINPKPWFNRSEIYNLYSSQNYLKMNLLRSQLTDKYIE